MFIFTPTSAVVRGFASATALPQAVIAPTDTVVVESPLPSGVAEIVRYFLNAVPPWMQIGGIIVGAAVAAYVLLLLFRRRQAIRAGLMARPPAVRWMVALTAVVVVAGAAGAGTLTWNYTQHSNDFCTGCHVMNPAFQKFSDAGNKHGELSCHACHQQSVYASMRQLYLWVAERPEKIKAHSKVANKVCENCHVTADTAKWQRVASTAGHRVHLESDSSSLKELQCVTCHGVEVHRFRPVDKTCGQTNCHKAKDTDIVLGRMATQTVRHCTSCHGFTAEVPALATRDSARGTLVPGKGECLGCHEMQKVLADFNDRRDPHGGKCGTCHNPHTQKTTAAAVSTCATGSCHNNWRDNPFHSGVSHRKVAEQCVACHAPHAARVDASGCEECHVKVRTRGRMRPPIPFDTARALRRMDSATTRRPPDAPEPDALEPDAREPVAYEPDAPTAGAIDQPAAPDNVESAIAAEQDTVRASPSPSPAVKDSFPHARHAKLACLECHRTGEGHGTLTFERPRGCAICHHQNPTPDRCVTCHEVQKYGTPKRATVTVNVPGRQSSPRAVTFLHSRHVSRSCVECHSTPVTLEPAPSKAACRDCHADHHGPERNCSTCHRIADPKLEHKPMETVHQLCTACHTPAIIAELTPTRTLCSTCHAAKATGHYDGKQCSVCHFLATPEAYRSRLTRPPA